MKRIYSILLSAVALLAFVPCVHAQSQYTIKDVIGDLTFKEVSYSESSNVGFSKTVSSPTSDGTYWIKLEAFAKGSAVVTTTSTPSDVILVLDVSSSMEETYNYTDKDGVSHTGTRLEALQDAATLFVKNIYDNAETSKAADPNYEGNRVAIVTYGGKDSNSPVSVDMGWTDVQDNIKKVGDTYSGTLLTTITGLGYKKGTRTDTALQYAYELLNGTRGSARTNANVTVVVFTDGCPSTSGSTTFTASYANNAAYYAHLIKSGNYGLSTKLYSIGLISSSTQDYYYQVIKFLNIISSNYPNSTINQNSTSNWTVSGSGNNKQASFPGTEGDDADPSGSYYQLVDANTDLTSIFDSISQQAGGSTNTSLSESTSTVDIVSSSFMLPANATAEDIKVFTAPCTGKDGDELQFGTETLAKFSNDKYDKYKIDENGTKTLVETDVDVDKDIAVVIGTDANNNPSIEVTGFDYSNNWCGSVTSGSVVTYQGHKVIILIPVKMNPDAVGGPNVETNAAGSGIYVNGDDDEPLITFDSPTVSLPVNIHIEKTGLEKGESAKFTIQRTTLPMSDSSTWEYVTSVFVTCTSTETDPIVKVRGLPSTNDSGVGFVYRVIEEGWSWSYDPDEDTYIQYTNTSKVDNPFTFENTKKDQIDIKVRHAESKATNIFNNGGSVVYNDSKNNGR